MGKRQRRRYRHVKRDQRAGAEHRPAPLSAEDIEALAEEFQLENHECEPTDPWVIPPDMACRICGRLVER